MNEPTTKSQLLDEIERAHQDMVRLLASLDDEEKIIPIRDNGWSVKDSLAHISAWETMAMGWLAQWLRGETVKRFVPGFQYETDAEREPMMHALNQHLFEQNRERAWADVMAEFRATHRAFMEFVADMDENDIFDPQRFPQRNGSPAFDLIVGDTYDHYAEHRDWILEWRAQNA